LLGSRQHQTPQGYDPSEIRDLDQTVIGNPAHDLVRLALSLATAARESDLPGATTARVLEEMMSGYEDSLRKPFKLSAKADITAPVQIVLRQGPAAAPRQALGNTG
jgi:uncharacterized protein (DUF2252 family)